MIEYKTTKNDRGEAVEIKGILSRFEFVLAEYNYLEKKYGIPIEELKVSFWYAPGKSDTAEIILPDGKVDLISFQFLKFIDN